MDTPNVIIRNPDTRRVVRTIIDVIGAAVFVAIAVDAATEAFSISEVTGPIMAGYAAVRSIFGFTVDNTNTPHKDGR